MRDATDTAPRAPSAVMAQPTTDAAGSPRRAHSDTSTAPRAMTADADGAHDPDATARVALSPSGLPPSPWADAWSHALAATGAEAAAHARALLAAARGDAEADAVCARAAELTRVQRSRFAAHVTSDGWGVSHSPSVATGRDGGESAS